MYEPFKKYICKNYIDKLKNSLHELIKKERITEIKTTQHIEKIKTKLIHIFFYKNKAYKNIRL